MGKAKRRRLDILRALQSRREETLMAAQRIYDVWEVRACRWGR